MSSPVFNILPNYDVQSAKALAKQVFEIYARSNQAHLESNDVSPMLQDAYRCMNKTFNPTSFDVQTYFNVLDRNGDGKVTLSDVEQLCIEFLCRRGSGQPLARSYVTTLESAGEKETEKSSKIREPIPTGSSFLDIIRRVFQKFDTDGNGYIDPEEVKGLLEETYRIMGMTNKVITPEDVTQYLKLVDTNNDGKVSLAEFEAVFMKSIDRLGLTNSLKESGFLTRSGISTGVSDQQEAPKKSGFASYRNENINFADIPLSQSNVFNPSTVSNTQRSFELDSHRSDQDTENTKRSIYIPKQSQPTSVNTTFLEVIRRVFKKFDEDGNGYIDPSELKHLLEETYRGLGIKKVITDRDVEHYLNLVDSNHDGKVSLQEFENLFLKSMEKWSNLRFVSSDNILRDSTNSPYRSLANSIHLGESEEKYKKSSFSFPRKMPEPHQKHLEQVRRIFNKFDKDRNGFIDADELRDLLEETYSGLGIKKNITNEDVKHYLKIVDTNNDGRISIQEYEDIFIRSLDRWSGKFL